jgi:hypothetical protein
LDCRKELEISIGSIIVNHDRVSARRAPEKRNVQHAVVSGEVMVFLLEQVGLTQKEL